MFPERNELPVLKDDRGYYRDFEGPNFRNTLGANSEKVPAVFKTVFDPSPPSPLTEVGGGGSKNPLTFRTILVVTFPWNFHAPFETLWKASVAFRQLPV